MDRAVATIPTVRMVFMRVLPKDMSDLVFRRLPKPCGLDSTRNTPAVAIGAGTYLNAEAGLGLIMVAVRPNARYFPARAFFNTRLALFASAALSNAK